MQHLLFLAVLCMASFAGTSLAHSQTLSKASAYPVAPAPGLYQALGEQAGIRALMDDFVQRVTTDPRIAERFRKTKLNELSRQLADQVCQLTGGPCQYKGANMKDAHADQEVTRADFNALVEVLQQTMTDHGVPFNRQNQLLAILAPMHRDVILSR